MTRPAPAIGWGLLAATALAAAAGPLAVQLGFATLAIGVIGMAHGASDLHVVEPARRAAFLIAYTAVSLVCLVWWALYPAIALPLFLAASAIHFAAEEPRTHPAWHRWTLGIGLIATPALLHPVGYASLLTLAGGGAPPATMLTLVRMVGAASGTMLLFDAVDRRDRALAASVMALVFLPPLIGFSVGFLVLHALPQTEGRRRRMRCTSHRAYIRTVGPILLAALSLATTIALFFLRTEASGIRGLFAALAALAMPHLLVTPGFGRDHGTRPLPRITAKAR